MEIPEWDPDEYVYVQVAEHLERRINAGEFPRGSRLPPERELAVEYGVAYMTMRRATAVLRERGVIKTLYGKGNFVPS